MRKLAYLAMLVSSFAFTSQPFAADDVAVGDTKLTIPAPQGFQEVTRLSPAVKKLAETITPPGNRLLAMYVLDSDAARITESKEPELRRYMMVQVQRKLEDQRISASDFAQVGAMFRQQQQTLFDSVRDKVNSQFSDVSGQLSKEAGMAVNLKVGEQVPLGLFLDRTNAVGAAALVKYEVSIGGKAHDYLMAVTTNFVLLKDKLIFAYVYGRYDKDDDIEWVRASTTAWTDQLMSANGGGARPGGDVPATGSAAVDWGGAMKKTFGGALGLIIIAAIIAAIYGVIKIRGRNRD